MYISLRMLAATALCSVLAACGGGDESGTAGTAGAPDVAPAGMSSGVISLGSGPSPAAPTSSGTATASTGTSSGVSVGTVAPAASGGLALPSGNSGPAMEPSGAAGQPIAAAAAANGMTTLQVKAATGLSPPSPSDIGSFRSVCKYSHMAFDDPIVFPGKTGASHLHTFFGNTSTDALSTTDSLLTANSSTCAGGTANQSAYWVPALVDTATSRALVPSELIVYYKKGYNDLTNAEIQSPPNGLRMIGGRSATATTAPGKYDKVLARFNCNGEAWTSTVPACPAGGSLTMELQFPNCWDGKNLDSPDHRSHMATTSAYSPKRCPASHPVPIPTITLNVSFTVEPGANASRYRLASDRYDASLPGGYSLHADVWLAWDESIKATWMKNCINAGMDCHAYLLGDGRRLY